MSRRVLPAYVIILCITVTNAGAGYTTKVASNSFGPALSADGRFVAFASYSYDLVSGDENSKQDVFVHDRQTSITERVSITTEGAEGNGPSGVSFRRTSSHVIEFDAAVIAISADGRFVAFTSEATNLVPGDTNGVSDVFVRDRQTGATERASIDSTGTEANMPSLGAALSADGRFVAFASDSDNLAAGDTNGVSDVFLHDRLTGATERVSIASGGVEGVGASGLDSVFFGGPKTDIVNAHVAISLSADGRFVAFTSEATNLVPGDTNGVSDVFVRDRQTGATERVLVPDGFSFPPMRPVLSASGRFLAFSVGGGTVFVHDATTGTTALVVFGDAPALSADGRLMAFTSSVSTLVPGDSNGVLDDFVYDRDTGTTTRASVDSGGVEGNDWNASFTSLSPVAISADGRLVAFESLANNLVSGDTSRFGGIFVHQLTCGDGAVDLGEQCDDGNAVTGDGCETDCIRTACGNGALDAGEQCDDGNTTNGDGCDADCTFTRCPAYNRVLRPTMTVSKLGAPAGDEALLFSGFLWPGFVTVFDPPTKGAQVLIEDMGSGGTAVLNLTYRTTPVPPGGSGSGCAANDGWEVTGSRYRYTNVSAAFPPACISGSANGLTGLVLNDRRSSRGIEFKVKTRHSTLSAITGPLRGTIVLGASEGEITNSECATYTFAAVDCTTIGTTMKCR